MITLYSEIGLFRRGEPSPISWRARARWFRRFVGKLHNKAEDIVAHPRDHARGISNCLTAVGLPLLAVLVIASGFHKFLWDNVSARCFIILILVSIAVAWLILRIKLTDPADETIQTFISSQGNKNEGEKRQLLDTLIAEASTFSAHYGTAVIALLADMLAEPNTYVHRSSESVEVGRRVTKRSVQLYLFVARHHLPSIGPNYSVAAASAPSVRRRPAFRGLIHSEADQKILIPLAQQEKGRMYERMSIRSQTDDNVVALSYGGGAMAAYVAVLMHLYSTVFDLKETYKEWDDDRQREFIKMVGWIATSATGLSAVGGRFAKAAGSTKARAAKRPHKSCAAAAYIEQLEEILNTSPGEDNSPADRSQRSKLLRIAKIGITHYVIIVQCVPAEYMNFSYAYSQPTANLFCPPRKDEGTRFTRKVQAWTKISNGFLRLSMASARHAKSYHMDISVQEAGSYIQQAHFQVEKEGDAALTEEERRSVLVNPYHPLSVNNPYLRKPTNSRASAHVYGRHLGRLFRDADGNAVTEIEDIPTGES
ncbi:hypothetical protein OG203_35530 [Nocardia sp. NBC_01499]|uniref:hypothetical protein n=1 Tax=Nocardia sp. NBC_01499 TaxID=2903597 RepID=UPI00386DF13D